MPKSVPVGKNVVEGDLINQILGQVFGNQDNITALAGGGLHATTPLLSAGQCRISVVANAADSVALPAAVPNPANGFSVIFVINDTATSMDVYPQSTDQINDGGAGVTLAQGAHEAAVYFCPSKGLWFKIKTA